MIVASWTLSVVGEDWTLVGLTDDLLTVTLADACPLRPVSPVGLTVLELIAREGDTTSLAPPVAVTVDVVAPPTVDVVSISTAWAANVVVKRQNQR